MNLKINIAIFVTGVVLFRTFLERKEIAVNNVLESMRETGYEGELHHVLTEDGYILGLQRIVNGSDTHHDSPIKIKRSPILIIHPLEASAIDWIHYHGKNSLPYLLFEKGYDVWLGNVRGAISSCNHTSLDVNKDAKIFWNISLHEIGYYDHPAMIDYILKATESEKISYIGMSQGEATFLILTSTRPEYNEKIELACLIAPSSHLNYSDNYIYKTLGKHWSTLEKLSNIFGVYEIPGRDRIGFLCQYQIFAGVCNMITNSIVGYGDEEQLDLALIIKAFKVYPSKSALKQLLHFLQVYNTGIFRQYDYGKEENLKRYGSTEPPEYDLKKVTAPVAYFWGENDCWSRPKDIEEIEKKLPNLVLSHKVPHQLFNHMDFMLARDVKNLVYDEIVETVEKYSS